MRFIEDLSKIIVSEVATLKSALKFLDQNGVQILLVTNSENVLIGLITDGDIRRHILHNGNLEVNVIEIANEDYFYLNSTDINKASEFFNKNNSISHIPIIDDNHHIKGLMVKDNIKQVANKNSQIPVVIMAGGKGTRLLPITKMIPKPLVPIGSQTMLEKIINNLHSSGFNKFNVIINYKKELIKSYMNEVEYSYKLDFVEESEYSGTVGGLSLLKGKIEGDFILSNCDIISFLNYSALLDWHKSHNAELTVLGVRKRTVIPYGVLEVNSESYITKINEKPHLDNIIVSGVYVLNSSVLDEIPEDRSFGMDELITKLTSQGKKVTCYPVDDGWHDIGQLSEYREFLKNFNATDV